MKNTSCPCGSKLEMNKCCGVFIEGKQVPETPEQLMRARYTAFVILNMDYIRDTTDPQTKLNYDFESNRKWAEESEFTKLEVLKTSEDRTKGMVEFRAEFRNRADDKVQVHHEISKFRKQAGAWYFRDGKVLSEA